MVAKPGMSRPELASEVIAGAGDEVAFLASRVREMWTELRRVTRRVQEVSSGLGSGRKAQKRARASEEVAGCHAQR